MRKWQRLIVMTLPVLMLGTVTAQSKPDFSGTWSFATDQTAPSGGATGKGGARAVGYLSGGAVNCMTECTIVQTSRTLTISRPADTDGVKPPDVVLNLDGSESKIADSFKSRRIEFTAHAKWDGGKLVVTHSIAALTITQTLALEHGRLTVVNEFGFEPETLTYVKK